MKSTLILRDLSVSKELDGKAMSAVRGGDGNQANGIAQQNLQEMLAAVNGGGHYYSANNPSDLATAIQQGYTHRGEPYHGYLFKMLTGQGPAAPLGALDFIVNGAMIGGFALAAAPAEYRVTGVKTFIVSHDGTVYQKDFGPRTAQVANAMKTFNPDKTWAKVASDESPR